MEYKDYVLVEGSFGSYTLQYKGKGSVPKTLLGSYTSAPNAKRAIDNYLESKNGKVKSSGRVQ